MEEAITIISSAINIAKLLSDMRKYEPGKKIVKILKEIRKIGFEEFSDELKNKIFEIIEKTIDNQKCRTEEAKRILWGLYEKEEINIKGHFC